MKKAVLWLLTALLCVGGCLEIEVDESDGRIEVSGGNLDVHQALRQLMNDRGWASEREGAQTSSTSSIRSGVGVSTREGLVLPKKSRRESSHSYIHAKTAAGKVVEFDVDRAPGQPTVIRVGVEEGAGVPVAEVTADLARRLQRQVRAKPAQEPLAIRIGLPANESAEPNAITGSWTARGDWAYPSSHVQFEIRHAGGARQNHSIYVEGPAPWRASGKSETDGPVSFRLERHAGAMVFEGQRWYGGGRGAATFEPNEAYLGELARIVNAPIKAGEALTLFFHDLDLDYARPIKLTLAEELTLEGLLMLASYRIAPNYVQGVRAAGYAFPIEQIVRLHSYHIPLEMLQGFKHAGYDFSADELIHTRNYHIGVDDFTTFRSAGYDFSIDEMIKARNYHIPVEMARTLHEAGFRHSLDELIRIRNYHVPPEYIVAFKQGGYDLSVDEIIKARNYHLDVKDAVRLKETGYDFSLDELINLRNYRVPVEFIARVHDAQYENFSARELIEFHQRQISAEAINKIRASKRKTQP